MSPYSRAQRVSAWVASRLAMNEVPTKGSPRGPGGRRGANVGAVADMSREALWETGAMIPQGRSRRPEGPSVERVGFVQRPAPARRVSRWYRSESRVDLHLEESKLIVEKCQRRVPGRHLCEPAEHS